MKLRSNKPARRTPKDKIPDELRDRLYRQLLDFKPSKSDLRRMAILDAVIETLAARGSDWLTSQEVGRRSKMRRSHVVYYFPNQEALLDGAIRYVVSVSQEIVVAGLALANTPEERLTAMIRATYQWFERYPKHVSVMTALDFLSSRGGAFRELHRRVRESGEARLESILLSGKKRAGAKPADARFVASAIRCVLVGAITQAFCTTENVDLEASCQQTLRAARELASAYWE